MGREMTKEESDKNERRISLIQLDTRTPAEEAELEVLQTWIGELLAEIAPLPRISDDPELLDLIERVKASQ